MKFSFDGALWEIISIFNELENVFWRGVTSSSTVRYSSMLTAVKYHLDDLPSKWNENEMDISPYLEDALLITRWVLTDMDQEDHIEDFSMLRALLRAICSHLEKTLHEFNR